MTDHGDQRDKSMGNDGKNLQVSARWMARARKLARIASWPAIALLTAVAFVLGILGFHENLVQVDKDKTFSLSTLVLLSIQMFVLSSGAQPDPINWKLEIARYAALFCSGSALIKAALTVFDQQIRRALFDRISGHQVICGFGLKGRQIHADLRSDSISVVELSLEEDDREEMAAAGDFPVHGDATHEANLLEAGVTRASRVFVVCGDDATNATIAAKVAGLIGMRGRASLEPVQIHVHIRDPQVFSLLSGSNHADAGDGPQLCEFRRFDAWMNAARIHLRNWPPDYLTIAPESPSRVRPVFLGWSLESESLLLQIAKMCHVANGSRVLSVLAFPGSGAACEKLLFRYPELPNIIDFKFLDLNPFSREARDFIASLPADEAALTSLYISGETDGDTFELGMTAKSVLSGRDLPVFLRLNQKEGISDLLQAATGLPTLRVFGGINPACKASTIIREDLDGMAKLIHRNYLELREKQKNSTPAGKWVRKPADMEWEKLPESYREDNRNNADHLEVKLRAVNCQLVREGELRGQEPHYFSDEEVEVLAAMEHARWNASKWLDGWRLGPRNDGLKLHDNLVPYLDLPEGIKEYDRDTVRKLPEVYGRFGYRIVRAG